MFHMRLLIVFRYRFWQNIVFLSGIKYLCLFTLFLQCFFEIFYKKIYKKRSNNASLLAWKSILFRMGVLSDSPWLILADVGALLVAFWWPVGALVTFWLPRWTLLDSLAFHYQSSFHLSELPYSPTE